MDNLAKFLDIFYHFNCENEDGQHFQKNLDAQILALKRAGLETPQSNTGNFYDYKYLQVWDAGNGKQLGLEFFVQSANLLAVCRFGDVHSVSSPFLYSVLRWEVLTFSFADPKDQFGVIQVPGYGLKTFILREDYRNFIPSVLAAKKKE